jgi:hypothetical protein
VTNSRGEVLKDTSIACSAEPGGAAEGTAIDPETPGSAWPRVEIFSRRQGAFDNGPEALELSPTDSRLLPGETRRFHYELRPDVDPSGFPLQVHAELWYHVMHETEAEEFHFSPEAVKSIICSERRSVARNAQR